MPISEDMFKEAMSHFASSVTVVTTRDGDKVHGLTASSFSSLSINPLLILFSLAKHIYSHDMLQRTGIFAVNILGQQQQQIAECFAGRVPGLLDRFANVPYRVVATGSPILLDAIAWMDCKLWTTYDGGDHTIFVGEVLDGDVSGEQLPLLYYRRRWACPSLLDPQVVEA